MDLETTILGLSYMGIFILMFCNGIFSFPSSQVLYIIVGYFIGAGNLTLEYSLLAGAIGNTIGNIALYEIAREHGAKAALKFLPAAERHLEKVQHYFNKHHSSLIFLFLGKLLPALKVFVPIFAGIAKVPRIAHGIIMFIGSLIWAAGFIAIGFYFGKNSNVFEAYSTALIFVSLLVLVFFGYSYMRSTKDIK